MDRLTLALCLARRGVPYSDSSWANVVVFGFVVVVVPDVVE